MIEVSKLDHYIESEDADADLYFEECPPEEVKALVLKLDSERKRADNHAETLRGIAAMPVEDGERMQLWARDGLSGSNETVEASLLKVSDERNDWKAKAESYALRLCRISAKLDEWDFRAGNSSPMADVVAVLRKIIAVEGTGPLHSADEPTNMDAMFRGWSKARDEESPDTEPNSKSRLKRIAVQKGGELADVEEHRTNTSSVVDADPASENTQQESAAERHGEKP